MTNLYRFFVVDVVIAIEKTKTQLSLHSLNKIDFSFESFSNRFRKPVCFLFRTLWLIFMAKDKPKTWSSHMYLVEFGFYVWKIPNTYMCVARNLNMIALTSTFSLVTSRRIFS